MKFRDIDKLLHDVLNSKREESQCCNYPRENQKRNVRYVERLC